MSFLGKLFGQRSAQEEEQRAEELFARSEHGLAKLAYERAVERLVRADEANAERLRNRINACRDAMARARIAEAERLLQDGEIELAETELQSASEIAADAELAADARRRIETLERREAKKNATVVVQAEDEHFDTIAGNWEEDQHDEYAAQGDALRSALIALYSGDATRALPALETALAAAQRPCYLWFETGRARLLDGKSDAGREALEKFVAALRPSEGGEARLVAHMELAALHHEQGRFEASVAEYQAAIEALPEDPRPYLAMATFFRREGLAAESVDVLEAASNMLEEEQRPWRLTAELGLAHADLGHDSVAGEMLEDVIAHFTKRQQMDFPPEPTLRLALLHEKSGNQARALDLYHLLAQGSDVLNHCTYYRQAARLMLALGHRTEARRMLQRAAEVAPDAPEIRAEIAAELDKLA